MKSEIDNIHYTLPDLTIPVGEPSYKTLIEWIKTTKGRRVSYDFWARGNYMRRVLYNHSNNISPILVRVKNIQEMSWAYKRLLLLDIPVEFIYTGKCQEGKVLHLCPDDITFDAGWGYISALGSRYKRGGRTFFPIMGYAKVMPESVIDWIVNNSDEDFLSGKVFIAPAELIGIHPEAPPSDLLEHSELTGGTSISDISADIQAIMELKLPFIDKLTIVDCKKVLNDYADHISPFREAFHNYAKMQFISEKKGKEALQELCMHINELTKSDKHIKFRDIIGTLGGVIGFTLSIAAAITQPSVTSIAAATGTAFSGIKNAIDFHEQLIEKKRLIDNKKKKSPYALFWKLGMEKPSKFKHNKKVLIGSPPKLNTSDFNKNSDYHWLCPPTCGLLHAAVKKE